MGDGMVLVVTGAGSYWGSRLARRLLSEEGVTVIGIDGVAPADDVPGLDFIQVDSRNKLLSELLRAEGVTALCHLDFEPAFELDERVSERNVQGLIEVLGACADAGVARVVVKSSTAVYGAHADNSIFLAEETALRGSRRYGYTRDLLEIEAFCNGFQGQWPDVGLTVLRFAHIIGPGADTPMTRFLSLQSPRILLGFDPMMQLVHEDDVVEALALAMLNDRPGAFNVAADDAMPLSRILRLARRVPIPVYHRFAYRGFKRLANSNLRRLRHAPIEWDYLRYPLVADLSRMHDELDFSPIYTAAESLREFAGQRQESEDDQDGRSAGEEQRLRDIIERRQRQRERQARI